MGVRIIDKGPQFTAKVGVALDNAVESMARDIETMAKVQKVPQKESRLQGTIVSRKKGPLHWIVPAETEYARFQEFGGDGKRKVRRYSKPGTGPHYLRDSGNTIKRNVKTYIKARLGVIKV